MTTSTSLWGLCRIWEQHPTHVLPAVREFHSPAQAGSDTLASLWVSSPPQVWLQLDQTLLRFWGLSSGGLQEGPGAAHEGFTTSQKWFLSSPFHQPNLTEAVKPHVSYSSVIFADCSVTTTVPDEWEKKKRNVRKITLRGGTWEC